MNDKVPDKFEQLYSKGFPSGTTANGSSVLLRFSATMGNELRRISKLEERSITTVVNRALRQYFKIEHNLEIPNEE